MTTSGYYKHWQRQKAYQERGSRVIKLVEEVRQEEPMTGGRKVLDRILPQLVRQNLKVGRDKFFSILGEHGMLVKQKRKYSKTTYSRHNYAVAPNRLKTTNVDSPNQVFVADITYIRLRVGFAYLFLVTDLFSRKIVGHYLSRDLKHVGAIEALRRAVKDVKDTSGVMHHSDRGCQYCCHDFLEALDGYGMIPSMTDADHCYQNAVAERVNGILKLEFFIDSTFKNFKDAKNAIDDAVRIYNTKRTHWSLDLKTPEAVYQMAA